jgi:hypothetical protein
MTGHLAGLLDPKNVEHGGGDVRQDTSISQQ